MSRRPSSWVLPRLRTLARCRRHPSRGPARRTPGCSAQARSG
ncbi:hypothetical protein ACFPRL_12110 [Pseudoclavibacter helvolus]